MTGIREAVQELVTDIITDINEEAVAIAYDMKEEHILALSILPKALEWRERLPDWSRTDNDLVDILRVLIDGVHIKTETLLLFGGRP